MVAGMYRMGAAISFAVMLLVVGIPLWWKTTEVHRAALPYRQIESINPSNITIQMKMYISCPVERFNKLGEIIKSTFLEHSVLNVDLVPLKIASPESVSIATLEKSSSWLPSDPVGNLILAQVPSINDYDIVVSNDRVIYFTPHADLHTIATMVKDQLLQDSRLQNKIAAIVSPESARSSDGDIQKAMRASPNYDIIVSVVNSEPSRIKIDWALKADLKRYLQPLMDQIDGVSTHAVKSQWLYLLDLGEVPKRDSVGVNVISYSQLPHIITPLEKKLGFGISRNPCVHLVLYVVSCAQTPMKFLSESGDYVDSMISPLWGGIQLLNPSDEYCENGTALVPDSKEIIGLFTAQFHSLLGISQHVSEGPINFMKPIGPLLSTWSLDSLYRSRIVEQITSASLTLKSLSKLLGEIGNIVINEDVAGSINLAVEHVTKAKTLLNQGRLVDALYFSKSAFSASEQAFSNPSLLALLYFPDDQKYAVYIPLFLPIMIPVLMSLKRIYSGVFTEKSTF